jgi:DMSO/TMAO reductase YedYZ molybdopterin-dependent catalytic subunit
LQYGAVGCVRWTGVRLADLRLRAAAQRLLHTGHHSPDMRLDGRGPAISRGLPIAKALAPETLVAWAINGEPIPPLHGGPLRLVAPGYPGSASQKWLTRIEIRDREHDGERMLNLHYRLPRVPVRWRSDRQSTVRRHHRYAGAFDHHVSARWIPLAGGQRLSAFAVTPGADMSRSRAWLSSDGGRRNAANLGPLPNRFAWRLRRDARRLPGPVEIIVRATDTEGHTQPLDSAPESRGYCNNRMHRITGTIFKS